MNTAEIRPFIGQMCTVKYGKTGLIEGTVLSVSTKSLHVKALGEYSIPLEQVTSVKSLT